MKKFSKDKKMKMPFIYKTPYDKKTGGTCLLIIDPQNDFVDPKGSLSVPGAVKNCETLAKNINLRYDDIVITLDTHQTYHIAHPLFWIYTKTKEHPKPFTKISYDQVKNMEYIPYEFKYYKWCLEYTKRLKKSKKFDLTIWPEHCLVGTWGHNVYPPLMEKIHKWEVESGKNANYVIKGNNMLTEHYSAMKAEVILSDDKNTWFNKDLLNYLKKFDNIVIGGQALSHCVNFTTRDLISKLPANVKVYLAIDTTSSVTGFEENSSEFIKDIHKRVSVKKISDI